MTPFRVSEILKSYPGLPVATPQVGLCLPFGSLFAGAPGGCCNFIHGCNPTCCNVDKTMSFAPTPSHHHFYRWYGYHSQSWVVKMALFYPHFAIYTVYRYNIVFFLRKHSYSCCFGIHQGNRVLIHSRLGLMACRKKISGQ